MFSSHKNKSFLLILPKDTKYVNILQFFNCNYLRLLIDRSQKSMIWQKHIMTSFQRTEHQGVHWMPLYILSQNIVINVTTNSSFPVNTGWWKCRIWTKSHKLCKPFLVIEHNYSYQKRQCAINSHPGTWYYWESTPYSALWLLIFT